MYCGQICVSAFVQAPCLWGHTLAYDSVDAWRACWRGRAGSNALTGNVSLQEDREAKSLGDKTKRYEMARALYACALEIDANSTVTNYQLGNLLHETVGSHC